MGQMSVYGTFLCAVVVTLSHSSGSTLYNTGHTYFYHRPSQQYPGLAYNDQYLPGHASTSLYTEPRHQSSSRSRSDNLFPSHTISKYQLSTDLDHQYFHGTSGGVPVTWPAQSLGRSGQTEQHQRNVFPTSQSWTQQPSSWYSQSGGSRSSAYHYQDQNKRTYSYQTKSNYPVKNMISPGIVQDTKSKLAGHVKLENAPEHPADQSMSTKPPLDLKSDAKLPHAIKPIEGTSDVFAEEKDVKHGFDEDKDEDEEDLSGRLVEVSDDEDGDQADDEENPETDPNLVEGDIAVPEDSSRLSINFDLVPAKRWPNNTIPYIIGSKHTQKEVLVIESAMQTIAFLSCIKFRVWDGKEKDYIIFTPDKKRKGCWSFIGKQGGRQQVSLEQPTKKSCSCFCSPGRALHEIMHTLGFYHEHSRSDRDKYIKIIKGNVRKGKIVNFQTKSDDDTSINFEYDYNSIMHYGPYFFSKNKRNKIATIVPREKNVTIGQREMLSKVDCMKINSLYRCLSEEDSNKNKRIQLICGMLGY